LAKEGDMILNSSNKVKPIYTRYKMQGRYGLSGGCKNPCQCGYT